jgi:hypothetical protein
LLSACSHWVIDDYRKGVGIGPTCIMFQPRSFLFRLYIRSLGLPNRSAAAANCQDQDVFTTAFN